MSSGPAWFSWFNFPFFAPLSGPVNQSISPVYKGSPEIEAEVVSEVASFGSQLGTLCDAVLELAERVERDRAGGTPHMLTETFDGPDTAVGKLRKLVRDVEEVKVRHIQTLERDAVRALDRLRAVDVAAYERVAGREGD